MRVTCPCCAFNFDVALAAAYVSSLPPRPFVGLTKKQRALLGFIHEHVAVNGVAPSYDEMKAAIGIKSKSGINLLIVGLEERGAIRRIPHRARAIEVTSAAKAMLNNLAA